jgi:hypothetical protein
MEEMPVLMEFPTPKGDVLIVNGLRPFLILIIKGNGRWEGFRDIQVNTNTSVGYVPSLLGCF